MQAIIWHLKADYATMHENTMWGQGIRSHAFIEALTKILAKRNFNSSILKVRVAHPLQKVTELKVEQVRLSYKMLAARGLNKFFKTISYKKPIKALNIIDQLLMGCRIEDFITMLKKYEDVKHIVIFDDISASFMFKKLFPIRFFDSILIYLSHNYSIHNYPSFLRSMVRTNEGRLIKESDLVIVSSERDRELYIDEYGRIEDKVVTFSNVFPPIEHPYSIDKLRKILSSKKNDDPTVVLNAGSKMSFELLKQCVSEVNKAVKDMTGLRIMVLGSRLSRLAEKLKWHNNKLNFLPHIEGRINFLNQLSKAHIGINFAYKSLGTNVKRFDFALAGLIVLSRIMGARGELLPYEYTYIDYADLKIKLKRLLEYDTENLENLGFENSVEALKIAHHNYLDLERKIINCLK